MVKSLIASELPVDKDITGHLGSVAVRLRALSPKSCTVEHQKQVRVSTDMKLLFKLEGASYTVPVRVLRSRIGMVQGGGAGYHTTLEFVQLPEDVRTMINRFVDCRTDSSSGPGQGIQA